jgi:hypothetical protein
VITFSERMGLKQAGSVIQLDSMNAELRVAISNLLHDRFRATWYRSGNIRGLGYAAARIVWTDHWYQPAREFNDSSLEWVEVLENVITKSSWNEV